MKKFELSILLLAALAIGSCKKENNTVSLNAGAINVTNAIIGAPTLTLLTNPSFISSSNQIGSNNFAFMPLASGQTKVAIGTPAVAATATTPAVPEADYYSQTFPVDKDSNYSLFLTGPSTSAVESILIKESYMNTYADSVCGVRFINLAQGNTPISVNLEGNTNGSATANIAYKAYSDFKQYPAKSVNSSYNFEFRNAVTGDLITTYTLTTPYFHNVTLAVSGNVTDGSANVILVNNY